MEVTKINNNHDELMIVNAARVSFSKEKKFIDDSDRKLIKYLLEHNHFTPLAHVRILVDFSNTGVDLWEEYPKDTIILTSFIGSEHSGVVSHSLYGWLSLIKNKCLVDEVHSAVCKYIKNNFKSLYKDFVAQYDEYENLYGDSIIVTKPNAQYPKHITHSFRIKAPIFIARQLVKHQVGLVWNEESRRYINNEPEFYIPETYRARAENVKQGSSEESVKNPEFIHDIFRDNTELALNTYKILLYEGVCPEQARMLLPLNTYTSWIWTGTREAFERVIRLRTEKSTQMETRELALMLKELLD